jgi:hypothetical protein
MTDELEQAFRDGLRQAADRVDTTAPLAERAREVARSRRRRRWTAMGAAAASVAVVSGVTIAVLVSGGADRRADDPGLTGPAVADWRAESWANLTVDVPADWGWGTAPVVIGSNVALCGEPGATIAADGTAGVDKDQPWVGRPVMTSDVCVLTRDLDTPTAPYVWLGAELRPGTVDLGDGWTQETVEAFGSTLTVATDDPELRRQIIDSARGTTGCLGRLAEAPTVTEMLIEGIWKVRSAEVCAYQRGDDGYDLVYATDLDEAAAVATHAGVYAGQRQSSPEFCADSGEEYVVITFTGDDRYGPMQVSQKVVISPECQEVQGAPGQVSPLSDAAMRPWSRNGLQAVLRSFIGMLG